MKLAEIKNMVGLDRLATCNEVRSAMMAAGPYEIELASDGQDFGEKESDRNDCAGVASEDILWLAIASEIQDFTCN